LDTVTIGASTYNNSDSDGLPDAAPCGAPAEDFIVYPDSRTTAAANDSFNDRLIYVTIDELMPKVERRVLGDAAVGLESYRTTHGRYPWLSPFQDPRYIVGAATNGNATELRDNNRDDVPPWDPDVDSFQEVGNAGDIVGYLVRNLTDGSTGQVTGAPTSKRVEFTGGLSGGAGNDFSNGDAYELRPPFNGSWTTREGHIPFIDLANNESFTFETGFTATWTTVGGVVPACTHPAAPQFVMVPGECGAIVSPNLVVARDGPTAAAVPAPPDPPPPVGNGVCVWTDDAATPNPEDIVNCAGTVQQPAGYAVSICDTVADPFCLAPVLMPVTRTFTFTNFSYTGTATRTTTNGVKTRDVVYDTAAAPAPQVTIQDSVAVGPVGNVTATITLPAGDSLTVSGIYFDIEDNGDGVQDANEDFPPYFFANNWHHYIYANFSASDVSGGGGNCAGAGDCLTLDIGAVLGARTDVRALLIGAGGGLAPAGQDRTDVALNIFLDDYFDRDMPAANLSNILPDDRSLRRQPMADFNDQVRVVGPNPP
jgi:hypothetical protein